MKIGDIDLGERPLMLAPMEDVTDPSFRLICKEMGADMVTTEFVSADALIRNIAATTRKLEIAPAERPAAIQIYGRDVDSMVEAARIVEEARPDVLDLNFGCPVKKVAGKGGGAGLLRDIPRMLEITSAIVRAVSIPVTVKTRLGWDHDSRVIVTLAEQLQDCGIQAIAIHGRTRSQMYTGHADWEMIARVKENPRLRIPVTGNGDIATPGQAREAFGRYGVDGVMVGRAAIGAPWIFREMRAAVDGTSVEPLTREARLQVIRRQIHESIGRIDEYRGILHIRRHLAASPLFKGIPDFRETRIAMLRAASLAELEAILAHVAGRYLGIAAPGAE